MIVRGNLLSDPALPRHHPTSKSRQIASARPVQVLPVQTMNLLLTDSPRSHRDESVRKEFVRPLPTLVRRHQSISPTPPLSPKLSSLPLKLPDQFDVTSKPSFGSRKKPVRTLTGLVRSKSQLSRYSHRYPELHSKRFVSDERSAISKSLHVDKMQLETILKKKHVHPQFTTDEWEDAKSNVAVIADDDDEPVKIRRSPRESSVLSFDASHLTLPSIDPSPGSRISPDSGRRSSLRRRQYTFVLPTLAEQIDNEQNSEQTT